MRSAFCLVVLVCLVAVSAGQNHFVSLSTVDEQSTKLMALENAWNQAQLRHDSRSLNTLVGDAFVYTDTDGTVMNKAEFLADIADTGYHPTMMANDGMRVFPYDKTAIVIGTYHAKGTTKGKPFDHYGRFTDTWVYQNGIWQCVASHTTLSHK
jgi:ketosteroid isomerase-like protein